MTAIEDKIGETVNVEAPKKELKEAVMVAVPTATPVASPEADIVAFKVFDELQVTVLEISCVELSE